MFGKKKESDKKEQDPREIIKNRIVEELQQLEPGQHLVYKKPEFFRTGGFGEFAVAELNPLYPEKGKKYLFYNDNIANGKLAGQTGPKFQNNNPAEVARWIADFSYRGTVERFYEVGAPETGLKSVPGK